MAQLWEIPSVIGVEQTGGCTAVTAGNPEAVLRRMLIDDATLSELELKSPGLEEAFLELTQGAA